MNPKLREPDAGRTPAVRIPEAGRPCWPAFRSRAMTGEGLEPSTHGLTYLTGFRRPETIPGERRRNRFTVECLDYLITVSGVPRLVSEADSREVTGISPADDPIPAAFHAIAVIVADHAVADVVLRASQQFATCSFRGWFIPAKSSRNGQAVPRSPMLYRLSYPVRRHEDGRTALRRHEDIYTRFGELCPASNE